MRATAVYRDLPHSFFTSTQWYTIIYSTSCLLLCTLIFHYCKQCCNNFAHTSFYTFANLSLGIKWRVLGQSGNANRNFARCCQILFHRLTTLRPTGNKAEYLTWVNCDKLFSYKMIFFIINFQIYLCTFS